MITTKIYRKKYRVHARQPAAIRQNRGRTMPLKETSRYHACEDTCWSQ